MSSRSVVGLEIAEGWVRGVELTRPGSRRPAVRAVGEVTLPAGAARDSEVLDTDAVAVALAQLWAQAGFKSKDVVLGVGNRRILVREHVAPALPLAQIKAALRFQVQDLLPVPVDQAVLDFYPVEPAQTPDGQEGVFGLLVSAVSENIDGLLAAITKARLNVAGVDLAPFGLARAAARVAGPEARSLVVHIGEATSWFVVIENGVPRFVRIVPAGVPVAHVGRARHVAEQEAGLDLMLTPAAPVATSPFPGFAASTTDSAPDPATGSMDEFITWFTATRDFYARAHPEKPLSQILVTGQGALHPDLSEGLRALSDVDVVAFGLNDAFAVTAPDLDPVQHFGALTAAGVAMGGEA